MTEQHRAELRRVVERMVRLSAAGVGWLCEIEPSKPTLPEDTPPLTTAQQLALSVLLGDDIPLGVLLSACEDAGVFADGLAGEIAEKARAEEREQGAIAAMMFTLTRADELRALPLYEMEAVTLDDHADWLRDRMMERA